MLCENRSNLSSVQDHLKCRTKKGLNDISLEQIYLGPYRSVDQRLGNTVSHLDSSLEWGWVPN